MTLLAILATVFGIVNGFANFPQIYKIYKTKSAKDIWSRIKAITSSVTSVEWGSTASEGSLLACLLESA